MTGLPNCQSSLQQEQHQHYLGQLDNNRPVMDDLLLEQIFSLPSWSDVGGGLGKVPLDYRAGGSEANVGLESSGAQRLFTMSLLPSGLPPGAFSEQGLRFQVREKQEISENQHLRESTPYCNGDRDFVSGIQQQHEIQGSEHAPVGRPAGSLGFNDSRTLNLVSRAIGSNQGGSGVHPVSPLPPLRLMNGGTGSLQFRSSSSMVSNGSPLPVLTPGSSNLQSPAMLSQSPSGRSSGSEGSAGARDCQSPPPLAPTFHQSYVGGTSPLPFALGQNKTETLLVTGEVSSGEAQFLGKRSRNEEVLLKEPISNQGQDGLFYTLAGGQAGLPHLGRTNGQPTSQENLPAIQGVVSPTYGNGVAAAQAQGAGQALPATAIINGVRPRVRARRGQATDPHSIAERLRRERIAERMKSLQELVPNSNKTDKASMLDEIIDYVKFLQLQVKVLSMSRLGGAGAVAQVIADLPSEGPSNLLAATLGRSSGASGPSPDGIALTEHQVARLMEEDMGTAMQYLQSKGLCLMPISLASAISSTGARSKAINQGALGVTCDDKERSQAHAVAYSMSNGLAMAGRTASSTVGVGGDGRINDIDSGMKAGNDGIRQIKVGGTELNLEEKANAFGDVKDSKSPKNGSKSTEEFQRQSQQ